MEAELGTRHRSERPRWFLLPTVLVSLLLVALPLFLDYVPDLHRGIVTLPNGSLQTLEPGFHFRMAGLQGRAVSYPLRPVSLDGSASLRTRDGISLRTVFSVSVRIAPSDLPAFHRRRGDRGVITAIREEAVESLRNGARRVTADVLFRPEPAAGLLPFFTARMQGTGLTPLDLRVEPQDLDSAFRVAQEYRRQNLSGAARRLLETVLPRFPRSPDLHIEFARLYDSMGEKELAEEQYLEALYLDLTRLEPLAWLYERLMQIGDLDRLERILRASLERSETSARHHGWLASVHFAKGELHEAETVLREGLKFHPDDRELLLNLAWIHMEREQFQEALGILEGLVRTDPQNFKAQAHLGIVLASLGRTQEALERFLKAERIGGASPDLYNRIARTYQELGQQRKAMIYLRSSLRLLPDQPEERALLEEWEVQFRKPGP